MKLIITSLVLLFSTSAFAARDCINQHQIRNFRAINSNVVLIDTARERFEMQVGFCSELQWAHRIGFDSFGGRVCRGDRLLIIDNFSNRVKQSCFIHNIRKI